MKYLKKFKSVEDANTQGAVGLYSPHVSIISGKTAVNIYKATGDTFTCTFDDDGKIIIPTPTQPNDEIWYTSSDGNIVTPSENAEFGANIVSNTYNGGKGIIKFDGNITSIGFAAFEFCISLTTISIPDSVTSIADWVFKNCTAMTTCTIGSGVTSIGEESFNRCSSLTGITIPDSITSIGDLAFIYCYGLTTCTIGSGVTSIGGESFNRCSSLTGITIPDSITSIGDYAFEDCGSLSNVICNPTTPPTLGSEAFANNASGRKIKVPSSSVDAYKVANNWSTYASDIISQ